MFKIKTMKNNVGAALVLAIFIILLLGLLITAGYIIVSNELEIATQKINDLQAMYCADAGIEHAIYNIRLAYTYDGTITATSCINLSNNIYEVATTESGDYNLRKTITATGTVRFPGGSGTKFQRELSVNAKASYFMWPTAGGLYYVIVREWRER